MHLVVTAYTYSVDGRIDYRVLLAPVHTHERVLCMFTVPASTTDVQLSLCEHHVYEIMGEFYGHYACGDI